MYSIMSGKFIVGWDFYIVVVYVFCWFCSCICLRLEIDFSNGGDYIFFSFFRWFYGNDGVENVRCRLGSLC